MADVENEVEDVKKDAPEAAKVENEDETPQNDALEPDEGIKELKMKLEQERAARIEAEKQARMAFQTAAEAKNETQDTNLQLVRNAIDTVKRNNEILKLN